MFRIIAATAWLFSAAMIVATPARADTDPVDRYAALEAGNVCAVLTQYPSFGGIVGIGQAIVKDTGWSYADAGRVIAESVATTCPQYNGLLQRFAQTYAPNSGSNGGTSGVGTIA